MTFLDKELFELNSIYVTMFIELSNVPDNICRNIVKVFTYSKD